METTKTHHPIKTYIFPRRSVFRLQIVWASLIFAATGCVFEEPSQSDDVIEQQEEQTVALASSARIFPSNAAGYSAMTANYLRMFDIDLNDVSDVTSRATQSEIERRRRALRPDWQDPESWVRQHRRMKWSDYYRGEQYPSSALQEQIDAAIAAGQAEVSIKPGIYLAPKLGRDEVMVTIEGAKNLTINAKDVFLIGQSSNRFLNIFNCEGLTLNDLVMDITSEGLPFTQGTIVACAEDGSWAEVEIHKGYPMPERRNNNAYKVEHYDARTLLLAHDTPTLYRNPYTIHGNVVRFQFSNNPGPLPVGDYLTLIQQLNASHGIEIFGCTDLTLRGIKLHTAPLFAIHANTSADTHYDGVEVTPGPIFDDADIPRLKSGTQDGLHIGDMRGDGDLIENCIFECHSDDGIAINSGYSIVLKQEGNVYYLTCKKEMFNIAAGDEVYQTRIGDMHRVGSAEVISATEVTDALLIEELEKAKHAVVTKHEIRGSGLRHQRYWRLELAEAEEIDGDQFFSRRSGNYGVTIRNNFIANHRARSLLLKTSGALVENNVIYHGQNSPLVMSTERFWTEGDYSRDMLIRNNTFIDCGYGWMPVPANDPKTSALFTIIGESKTPSHDNLVFENNRFEFCHRMPIWLSAASNIRVENNHIKYTSFRELRDQTGQPHIMRLEHVDNVLYRGNKVDKVGRFYKEDPVHVMSGTNIVIE
jgi:hypothetical protein